MSSDNSNKMLILQHLYFTIGFSNSMMISHLLREKLSNSEIKILLLDVVSLLTVKLFRSVCYYFGVSGKRIF